MILSNNTMLYALCTGNRPAAPGDLTAHRVFVYICFSQRVGVDLTVHEPLLKVGQFAQPLWPTGRLPPLRCRLLVV